jgi:hypothetical protein
MPSPTEIEIRPLYYMAGRPTMPLRRIYLGRAVALKDGL